ncbi:MAG: MaoC family dehydratase [Burkholderiaceae bacterium]
MRTFAHVADLASLVGQEVGTSDWVGVTQASIDQFAQATGDAQWIHVDPVRAADGPFAATVAHGFLTLSLLSRLFAAAISFEDVRMSLNYGLDRVRFPAPVPVGSRLRAVCVLKSFEAVAGGAQVTLTVTLKREGGTKPACVAEWITRHLV